MNRKMKGTAKIAFGWNLLFWSLYFMICAVLSMKPDSRGLFDIISDGYPLLIIGSLGITGIVTSIKIILEA